MWFSRTLCSMRPKVTPLSPLAIYFITFFAAQRSNHDTGSEAFAAFKVAVKIFVRAHHQQFEGVFIEQAVSQKTLQVAHPKLEHLHAGQIAEFGLTHFRLICDRSHGLVKHCLLLLVQLFDGAMKGWGNQYSHQPNWYSPAGSS